MDNELEARMGNNFEKLILKFRDEHLKRRAEKKRELDRIERDIDNLIRWSDRQDIEIESLKETVSRLERRIRRNDLESTN